MSPQVLEELNREITHAVPRTRPINADQFRTFVGAGREVARIDEALAQVTERPDIGRVQGDVTGMLRQLLSDNAGTYWLLHQYPQLQGFGPESGREDLEERAHLLYGTLKPTIEEDVGIVEQQIMQALTTQLPVSGFAPFRVPGYREDCEVLLDAFRRNDRHEVRAIIGTMGGSFTEWTMGTVSAAKGIQPQQFLKRPLGQAYCRDSATLWNNMVPSEVSEWVRESGEPAVVLMGTAYPIRYGESSGQTHVTHWAGKQNGDRDVIGPSSQVETEGWTPPAGFPTLEQSFREGCIDARRLSQFVRAMVIGRNDSQAVHLAALAEIQQLGIPLEQTGGGIQGTGFNTSQFMTVAGKPLGVVLESGHAEGDHWGYDVPAFHAGLVNARRADQDAEVVLAGKVMRPTLLADIGAIDPALARHLNRLSTGELAQMCFDCVEGMTNGTYNQLSAQQKRIVYAAARPIVDRSLQGTVKMLSAIQKTSGMQAMFFDGSRMCSPLQRLYAASVNTGIKEQTGVSNFARIAESTVQGEHRSKLSRTTEGAFWQAYAAALQQA